jgi:hypothetical protein
MNYDIGLRNNVADYLQNGTTENAEFRGQDISKIWLKHHE